MTSIPAGPHAYVQEESPDGDMGLRVFRVTVDVPFELRSMAEAALEINSSSLRLQGRAGSDEEVHAPMPSGFALDPNKAKNSGNAKADTAKKKEDIPYISGSGNDPIRDSLKLPEVQEALKQTSQQMKNDQSWITPQLMKALQARPDLRKGLQNPKVMEAMALMQTDADAAQSKYGSDPEVAEFLQNFSSLMATHFDVLSKDAPKPDKPAAGGGAPAVAATQALASVPCPNTIPPRQALATNRQEPIIQEKTPEMVVFEDPQVQEAFRDPEVQHIIAELRAGKNLEMRELAGRNPRLF